VAAIRIEKLHRGHGVDAFDCGREALNRFLTRYAFQNRHAGASQTYPAFVEEVVGYYTLAFCQVEYSDAPERLVKCLARRPVPIMLLARLAIASSRQGKGSGSGLLKDAMQCTLLAAEIAGTRAFAVRFHRVAERHLPPVPLAQGHSRRPEIVK
jgi:hypothetical protein